MKKVIVGGLGTIILIALLLMGYFILLKPEANKQKELQKLVEQIEINTEITTNTKTDTKAKESNSSVENNIGTGVKELNTETEATTSSTEAKVVVVNGVEYEVTYNSDGLEVLPDGRPVAGLKLYDETYPESEQEVGPGSSKIQEEMQKEDYNRNVRSMSLTAGNIVYYLQQNILKPKNFTVINAQLDVENFGMIIDVKSDKDFNLTDGKKQLGIFKEKELLSYFEGNTYYYQNPMFNFEENVKVYWENSPSGRLLIEW